MYKVNNMVDCQMTVGKEYSMYAKWVGGESILELVVWLETLQRNFITVSNGRSVEKHISNQSMGCVKDV